MKTKNILIVVFAVCMAFISLSGCKDKKQVTQSPDLLDAPIPTTESPSVSDLPPDPPVAKIAIAYRRTACFGTCPIFEFEVHENGFATYNGKNFVDRIGFYTAKATEKQIAEIASVANSIHFFEMNDVYDNEGVTDLPSVYVSVAGDKGLKQVKSRYQGPKELKTLTEKMDILIKELDWKLMSNENKD